MPHEQNRIKDHLPMWISFAWTSAFLLPAAEATIEAGMGFIMGIFPFLGALMLYTTTLGHIQGTTLNRLYLGMSMAALLWPVTGLIVLVIASMPPVWTEMFRELYSITGFGQQLPIPLPWLGWMITISLVLVTVTLPIALSSAREGNKHD